MRGPTSAVMRDGVGHSQLKINLTNANLHDIVLMVLKIIELLSPFDSFNIKMKLIVLYHRNLK